MSFQMFTLQVLLHDNTNLDISKICFGMIFIIDPSKIKGIHLLGKNKIF